VPFVLFFLLSFHFAISINIETGKNKEKVYEKKTKKKRRSREVGGVMREKKNDEDKVNTRRREKTD